MSSNLLSDFQVKAANDFVISFLSASVQVQQSKDGKPNLCFFPDKNLYEIRSTNNLSHFNTSRRNAGITAHNKTVLNSFLLPHYTFNFYYTARKLQESDRYPKNNPNLYAKGGSTSYRKRNIQLNLEKSIFSNTIFNRTHKLLMFGTKDSLAEKVSDDEDPDRPAEFLASRFNLVGNVTDELSYFDNSTNSDIYRCSMNFKSYSPETVKKFVSNRQNFVSEMKLFRKSLSEVRMNYPMNFRAKPEDFQFKPLNYVRFYVTLQILQELFENSTLTSDCDSIPLLLDSIYDIIRKLIDSNGSHFQFVCNEITLRFIYITFLLCHNISDGLINHPKSLFSFLESSARKGIVFEGNVIINEVQLIQTQIEKGGIYCFELTDYKALALAAELNKMDISLKLQIEKSNNQHENYNFYSHDPYNYVMTFKFVEPLDISISYERIKNKRTNIPVLPLRDMFSKFFKVEQDLDGTSQLPW